MMMTADFFLFNFLFSIIAGFVCAAIPFLFGYGFDKRAVGDSRAKFLFVFVTIFGSLLSFVLGAYLGLFAALVFTVEILFLGKKEHQALPQ